MARIGRPRQLRIASCTEVPPDGAAVSASLPGTTTASLAEVVVDSVAAKPEGSWAPNTPDVFLELGDHELRNLKSQSCEVWPSREPCSQGTVEVEPDEVRGPAILLVVFVMALVVA